MMINSDVFKAAIVCVFKNEKFDAQSGCDRGQYDFQGEYIPLIIVRYERCVLTLCPVKCVLQP